MQSWRKFQTQRILHVGGGRHSASAAFFYFPEISNFIDYYKMTIVSQYTMIGPTPVARDTVTFDNFQTIGPSNYMMLTLQQQYSRYILKSPKVSNIPRDDLKIVS